MAQDIDLLERMRRASKEWDFALPEFNLKLGVASDYGALLDHTYSAVLSANELPDTAQETGRLLVHGYAGSGKTQLLYRLYRDIVANDKFAVLVRLRDLVAEQSRWNDFHNSPHEQAQILLGHALPAIDEATARTIPGTLFVLADGLDEVPSELALSILRVLDGLAQRLPNLIVIVTDRFSMRPISTETWRLASIQPLEDNARPELPSGTAEVYQRLLAIPLFVDLLIKGELPVSEFRLGQVSMARILKDVVERAIPTGVLNRISQIAYDTYAKTRSRVFSIELFADAAEKDAVLPMQKAGLLKVRDGLVSFTQNLVQDYLVARYFASEPALWDQRGFDAVSFDGASYDVLVLAAEVLAAADDVALSERFVHQLYDWSFYAVGFVLARTNAIGSHAISSDTAVAVESMMAARRWDRITSTRSRVTDALRMIGDSKTSELLKLVDFEELRSWVAAQDGATSWFSAWRALFLIPVGTAVDAAFVEDIADPQSILGWTAANVVKQTAPTTDALARLRGILSDGADTVRWRAAHALGAFPAPENVSALVGTLANDAYPWARYGAVRSLVEQASLTNPGELRDQIIQALADTIKVILADQRLTIELERSLEVDPVPESWARSLDPLLTVLWDLTSGELQFSWERMASRLEEQEQVQVGAMK